MELGERTRRLMGERATGVKTKDFFSLAGGLDIESSPLDVPPGFVLGSSNFEPGVNSGYARIDGVERLDGQLSPSEADFWKLSYDAGNSAPFAVGDFVFQPAETGAPFGCVVLYYPDVPDTTGYLILRSVQGTFVDDGDLVVNGITEAVANGLAVKNVESTDALFDTAREAVEESLRALIKKVGEDDGGTGPVLGVWIYNGREYAFRDVSGAGAFWRSSTPDLVLDGGFDLTNIVTDGVFALPDLVSGGAFTTDADWQRGDGWQVDTATANKADCDGTQEAVSDLRQIPSTDLISGRTYTVTYTISSYVAGNVAALVGGTEGVARQSNGTFVENIVAGRSQSFGVRADVDFDGAIDDITVTIVDWVLGTGWFIASGVASKTGGIVSDLAQTLVLLPGRTYTVVYTVANRTTGNVTPKLGGTAGITRSGNATFTEDIAVGSDMTLLFTSNATFDGDIDTVSVAFLRWGKGVGWDIAAGVASCDGTQVSNSDLFQTTLSLTEGAIYTVIYTVLNYSAGDVRPVIGGFSAGLRRSANGTFIEDIVGSSNDQFILRANSDFVGDIDNVSIVATGWSQIPLGIKIYYTRGGEKEIVKATNAQIQSRDLTNAEWTATTMTTALDAPGMEGTANTGTTLTATSGNATVIANAVTAASAPQTTRWFIKRKTGTGTINITVNNGGQWLNVTVKVDNDTDVFAEVLSPVTTANPQIGIRLVTSGDAVIIGNAELHIARTEAQIEGIATVITVAAATSITTITPPREIEEDDHVIGVISGALAQVRRVVVIEGTFKGSDANGFFIADTVSSGPFVSGEELQVVGEKVGFTIVGTPQVAQALNENGRYRFHSHNFGGHTSTYRMYGVNSVDFGFEYDDDNEFGTFVQIETGMEDDTPQFVEEFNNHLFFSFSGGSIQHSGHEVPLVFNPILGADERTVGDTVTNFFGDRNRAIFITTRNNNWVLYGNVREDFQLRKLTEETGAIADSLGTLGPNSYFLDDLGVSDLEASEKFGNYLMATRSELIERRLQRQLKKANVYLVGNHISRRKNLIRWMWNDGLTLVMGFWTDRRGDRRLAFMEVQNGITPQCMCSEELQTTISGAGAFGTYEGFNERILVGSDDGYVYEIDKGTTLDGAEIEGFLRTAYHATGDPGRVKRYRRATFDMDADRSATVEVSVDYNYGNKIGIQAEIVEVSGAGGFWDIDSWDEFFLDGAAFTRPAVTLNSSGYNVGFFLYTKQKYEPSWTVSGVTLGKSWRRIYRDKEV